MRKAPSPGWVDLSWIKRRTRHCSRHFVHRVVRQPPDLGSRARGSHCPKTARDLSGERKAETRNQNLTLFSNIPNMFVIARNSTFTYKGKAVKVQQVSEDLGVRYVLEGSIQKSGDRLRVSVQLIDALNGYHL